MWRLLVVFIKDLSSLDW